MVMMMMIMSVWLSMLRRTEVAGVLAIVWIVDVRLNQFPS